MQRVAGFTASLFFLIAGAAAAEGDATTPQPGRRVLVQGNGRAAIVNAAGAIEWEAACGGVSHDIAMLPNGNLLLHTGATTIVEMTPEKKIVWRHESKPKTGYHGRVEIHAFQRLPDGLTMVAESGNCRIIEVDKDDKIVRRIPFSVDHPNSHSDVRLARKLENGHYLVCHEADGVVREYNDEATVVWSYALDLGGRPASPGHGVEGHGTSVFGAVRLPNGNTLIACGNGNRVIEVTPKKEVVWKIDHDELPGVRLAWVTTLEVLPSGNVVFGNCHAGPSNPQMVEVTREKKVVWTLHDFENFGNDVAAAQVLDAVKVIR